jgi:beta-lactamase regulating signal transducer with metallopeptidase domain
VIDWLTGTLLATSGLILLVLLIREPVRRHFGARVAYGLWLIPAARLLMPTLTQTIERPVGPAIRPGMMGAQYVAEPLLLSSVASPERSLIEEAGGWSTILLILWLGVALGLFLGRLFAFRRERAAILSNAEEIARIGSIRIVRSSDVTGPLAFGIVHKVIAVPNDFETLYAERERRLALEHEIAHHRSGDLIANLVAFGLLCLQWFNPLAWAAHSAFRFDQEAACDARVLDRVKAGDRSEYGRAIAKAASGRTLLFASALDRRNTLHRRLKSMLSKPSAGRRLAGRATVLASIAVALPLTASRAIEYVDVPMVSASEPVATPVAVAAVQAVQTAPAVQAVPAVQAPSPGAPVAPIRHNSSLSVNDRTITMNGQKKRWQDLTPAEKAEVRKAIAQAKEELKRVNVEDMQREMRQALEASKIDQEKLRRALADARAEIEDAVREIDANAAELRLHGQDPDRLKAKVRASLASLDADKIIRQVQAANPERIAASMAKAQDGLRRAEAEIARMEALDRRD